MRPEGDAEFPVRHYLRIVRRRKWTIVLCTVAIGGISLALSLAQPKIFEAEAKLVLQPEQAESVFNPQTGQRNDPVRAVQTEIEIITSRPIEAAVAKEVGATRKVSASAVGRTDVISLRARDRNAVRAARIANAYAEAYVEFKRKRAVDSLLSAAREINRQVTDIQAAVNRLDAQIAQDPGSPAASQQRAERDSLIQQIGAFRQELDRVQVQARLKSGGAQIVTSATPPNAPSEPRPVRTTILGVVLGLVLGLGFAFVREQMDESIRTMDDLAGAAGELPVLAMIPAVESWRQRNSPLTVSLSDPTAPAAEAYRGLRTAIQFTALGRRIGVVQITSASADEGKTTTLANLGVAFAGTGLNVVIACCDLRRPRVHEFFGLTNEVGFTSVLLGTVPLDDALQPVPGVDGLQLLASGPLPPNPSELLSFGRSGELLEELQGRFDIVLIDSPPLLPVTDASVVSRWADATVVVAMSDKTSRKALRHAIDLLRQVDATVVGVVLNGTSTRGTAYS